MEKKVLYALLGGAAALVGAAVAYHMFGASEDASALNDDLQQLGPLELEEDSGMLKFTYFMKIMQISSYYGKTEFGEKKKEYIKRRRQALQDGNDKVYEEIVV